MAGDADSRPTSGAGNFSSAAQGGGMTVEECQNMIQRSLRTPMVKFLKEHLEKSGCSIGSNFIKAVNCEEATAGGYVAGGGIVVCSNHLQLQDEVTQVVIHELIHAYDDCRAANLDWTNCAHHACSEDVTGLSPLKLFRELLVLPNLQVLRPIEIPVMDCIRRRVMKSVTANPYCSEAAAKDAMEAVWDVCYNDTKPFDRAP
ncbi:Mitochondrial inner membrane protease ATP23 [Sesamum angolense]|uniref:Mitochondrial inner membrane protease ATP23 n=1 Tax=Sesamum angolense TaxID=2727404 RepID=A0AAE1W5B7_9LAMI|nr:Mitochondrial inner membrane protease ATP23 [Sesamum angolense]